MKRIALPALAAGLLFTTASFAQTTQQPSPSTTPPAASDKAPAERSMTPPASTSPGTAARPITLTDAEAKAWIDKVVYSSDNKNVGEVAAFARDASGKVTEMHADIGGFLGMGETRVKLLPSQFSLQNDRVVLNITSEQVKGLPHLKK